MSVSVFALAKAGRITNRVLWDGEQPLQVDGELLASEVLPEGWDIGWRLTEAGWAEPPAPPINE